MFRVWFAVLALFAVSLTPALHAEGLIYQLPPDGAMVRYDAEVQGADPAQSKSSLVLSSVGTEDVAGSRCRWLEIALTWVDANGKNSTMIHKLLVPENQIGFQKDPLRHVVQAWTCTLDQDGKYLTPPEEIADPTGEGAMRLKFIQAFLYGPYKESEKLAAVTIETSLGKFDCPGYKAKEPFPLGPKRATGVYIVRLNRQVPFGVVQLIGELQFEKDGKTESAPMLTLKLVEMGKNVKTALPLPDDVANVPDDIDSAVRILAPRAASFRSHAQWKVVARADAAVKLEILADQPLAMLLRSLPLETPRTAEQQAEFQWLAKEPRRSLMAKPYFPSGAEMVSPLQPDYISKVTAKAQGDSAVGKIDYLAPDVYGGTVEFTAKKVNGKWALVEFRLPAHKLKTSRNEKGLWKVTSLD